MACRLCSMHFSPESFEQSIELRAQLGSEFKPRRLRLKADALPTIFNFERNSNWYGSNWYGCICGFSQEMSRSSSIFVNKLQKNLRTTQANYKFPTDRENKLATYDVTKNIHSFPFQARSFVIRFRSAVGNCRISCLIRVDFQCCVFFYVRIRTECSEHVNSFVDAYWVHVRKRT